MLRSLFFRITPHSNEFYFFVVHLKSEFPSFFLHVDGLYCYLQDRVEWINPHDGQYKRLRRSVSVKIFMDFWGEYACI